MPPRREPHFVGFSTVPSFIVDHHSTVPDIAVLMGFRRITPVVIAFRDLRQCKRVVGFWFGDFVSTSIGIIATRTGD
jgi:hypothetical protein